MDCVRIGFYVDMPWGWALHDYPEVVLQEKIGALQGFGLGASRNIRRLGTERIFSTGKLCGWPLQGGQYSAIGHCRDTFWLVSAGILCSSALPRCRDTLWLGTAGILCRYSAVGNCSLLQG